MRRHGAAGVELRVDQRRELPGGLQRRVQLKQHLVQDRQVGSEASGCDDRVHTGDASRPAAPDAVHGDGAGVDPERVGGEVGHQLDRAGVDEGAQVAAELAAGGELVGVAAAVEPARVAGPDRPHEGGSACFAGEFGQCQHSGGCRVPEPRDEGPPAGEAGPVAAEHFRQRSAQEPGSRRRGLADGGQPSAAERVGRLHVPEASMTALARTSVTVPAGSRVRTRNGRAAPGDGAGLVQPVPADGDDAPAGGDAGRRARRQAAAGTARRSARRSGAALRPARSNRWARAASRRPGR